MQLAARMATYVRNLRRCISLSLPLVLAVSTLSAISVVTAPSANAALTDSNCAPTVSNVTASYRASENYCIVTFTAGSGTWTSPSGVTSVRVLVVGGGAGGDRGVGSYLWGHGGGGGQVIDTTTAISGGQNISIAVGDSGTAGISTAGWVSQTSVNPTTTRAGNGGSSSFGAITSSGGQAASIISPSGGTSGNGYPGGVGTGNMTTSGCVSNSCGAGGGGGAGGSGDVLNGGPGIFSDITGSSVEYGAGGAGKNNSVFGSAGGGASRGANATVNRGGGGSDSSNFVNGTYGGSGVVIVKYAGVYTVTYNYNGATADSSTATSYFTLGGTAITLPTPTKTGYTFAGWYSDSGLTTSIGAAGAQYSPTTSLTAYAKWTTNTYTVTYNYNGATADSATATSSFTTGGTAITLPTPTKTGYTFGGWYSDSGLTSSIGAGGASYSPTSVTTSITAYAKWTGITYTITYSYNGATADSSTATSSYTTGGTVITLPTPTKTGYTFAGWFEDSGFSGSALSSTYSPTQTRTIYAKWTANTNNAITYNNYSATTAESGGSTTYTTGEAIATIPTTAPLKTGYTFAGWFTASSGGVQVTNGSYTPASPYGSITLHAQWTANTNNAITYNNYSATTAESGGSTTYTTGEAIATIPTTAPLKTGYTFAGWFTASSGGVQVTNGSYTPASPYGSITLHAQWTANTNNAITYNNYSATTAESGGSTTYTTGEAIATIPTTAPLKTGYTFAGWFTASSGGVQVTNGSYTPASPYGSITLHAQWIINCSVTSDTSTVIGYTILKFSTVGSCAWLNSTGLTGFDIALVGGGGAGGWGNRGGGGGAGQVVQSTSSITLSSSSYYLITVGGGGSAPGGTGAGLNGTASTIKLGDTTLVSAIGGGGGAGSGAYAGNGGSGGAGLGDTAQIYTAGGTGTTTVTAATPSSWQGFGNNGATLTSTGGAGGGGAGAAGSITGPGGIGVQIWNSSSLKVGGGGQGIFGTGSQSNPATYGGGYSVVGPSYTCAASNCAGTANTGGGGGSRSNGGSGVIYIRYANTYTITYSYNGATADSSTATSSYTTGGTVITLPTPIKTGYTFAGWFEDSGFSGSALSSTYSPTQTRTIYAQWTANTNNAITYNNYSATTAESGGSTTYTTGEAIATIPTTAPLKTGYTFAGWFTASSGGVQVTNGSYTPASPYGSITLHAQWTANIYTLTYNYNGATADSSTATSSFTTGGTAITLPTPTKTGYTFAGWYSDSGLTSSIGAAGTSYSPTGATTSLTAYAKWTGITYTITYKAGTNGTGSDLTQTFVYGGSATLKNSSAAFIRVGYSITAWSTSDGGSSTNSLASTYSASSNITLYPVWTANTYTVTFDAATNGGSALVPDTSTFTVGTSAITLKTPSARSGYTESGWYTAATGGTKIGDAAGTYSPTSDITLYFQWVAINYTVTYNASTASSGSVPVNGSNYNIGNNITIAGNPNSLARIGYTFAGWTDNSSGTGTIYTSGNTYTVASANVNFYAKWTANSYTITYNANGGSGSPTNATATYTTGSTEVTLSTVGTLAKTGYDFDGWSTSPTGSKLVGTYTTTSDVTLYAVWNIKTITVTYDKGIASSSTIASFPTTDSGSYNSTITLPTPTSQVSISGGTYQFSGWKLSGASATYEPGTSYILPATNPTLQAQWIQVFEVTYIFNGGTSSTGFNYDAQCDAGSHLCTNNQSIQADAAPTRSGYDFTGWRDQSGNPIAAGATFSVGLSRYILYAQWTAIDYAITYQAAGGSSTPTQSAKQISQNFTVANAITKSGYSFGGWNDGTLTYGAGAIYTVGASAVTLTAQWIPDVYSISYDWNGGSGSTTTSDTFTVGNSAVVLPLVTSHTKDGYEFGGWALTPTGTTVGLSYTPTSSITLYAVWGPGTFTVSYNANGGSVGTSSANVANGSSATLPTPTRANYVFNGWYTASSGGSLAGAAGASYLPSQSRTLYAQWIQASLYGIAPSALTYIGTLNASNVIDVSFSGSNAGSRVSVSVPAGSLPNGTDVNLHLVGDFSRAQGLISASNSYIISLVVSWVADDGTVPETAANKPVSVVIANSTIKQGMSVYSIVGSTVELLGTASADGSITVSLTQDPEVVVVATKPAAPTLISATTGGDKQSTIAWTAGSDGGSTVTGYTATAITGESCTTVNLTCSITGLSASTNYTFTVKATNAIGTSDSSNSISIRTADASSPSSSSSGTASNAGGNSSGTQNILVSATVTVVGSNKEEKGTPTAVLPTLQGEAVPTKLKIDSANKKFIADAKIVDSKIVLTPEKGFSGKKTVTVTVTTGGTEQVVQIPLIVLPEVVSKPVVEPISATKTVIKWVASTNGVSYKVFVNGQQICLSTTTSCVVKSVLGPNSVVEIVSNGGDRTTSEKVEASLVQKNPVVIDRIFSANIKTGALTQKDINSLNRVANVIKSQGFTTVVISRIVTTSKTSKIASARVEAIKSYLQKIAGDQKLNFEVVPSATKTYFNNIALKN